MVITTEHRTVSPLSKDQKAVIESIPISGGFPPIELLFGWLCSEPITSSLFVGMRYGLYDLLRLPGSK